MGLGRIEYKPADPRLIELASSSAPVGILGALGALGTFASQYEFNKQQQELLAKQGGMVKGIGKDGMVRIKVAPERGGRRYYGGGGRSYNRSSSYKTKEKLYKMGNKLVLYKDGKTQVVFEDKKTDFKKNVDAKSKKSATSKEKVYKLGNKIVAYKDGKVKELYNAKKDSNTKLGNIAKVVKEKETIRKHLSKTMPNWERLNKEGRAKAIDYYQKHNKYPQLKLNKDDYAEVVESKPDTKKPDVKKEVKHTKPITDPNKKREIIKKDLMITHNMKEDEAEAFLKKKGM